jgi:mono/diheme cytochrome c family protein
MADRTEGRRAVMRRRLRLVLALPLLAACNNRSTPEQGSTGSAPAAARPASFGLGHRPDSAQLAALNIDVNPAGVGLPPGSGTAALGAGIFAQKCAMCHGPHGEGMGPYPQLIGRTPPAGFVFASDPKAPKTIGNYWPYATTVYDYVHRTMPFNAPGSLSPDETYSLVAYLLSENGVIPASETMDARTLPAVQMPARGHFVMDNRRGGPGFR